jgi:hypothetical protein
MQIDFPDPTGHFVLSGKTTIADAGFSLIPKDILYPLVSGRVIGEIWPVTLKG